MSESIETFHQEDWDEYAKCYDSLLNLRPYQQLCAEVAQYLRPQPNDMILDAGCGTGNIILAAHKECNETSFCGIDLSQSMLRRAQEKCVGVGKITFMRSDLNSELMFLDRIFSKVSSVNVLYAVPDPVKTLCELHRILRHKGTLVLVTPKAGYDNGYILKEHAASTKPDAYWSDAHRSPEREAFLLQEAIQDPNMVADMLLVARHNRHIARNTVFHFFTEATLETCVRAAGFKILHITPAYAGQALLVVAVKG